jgi:hypothetical protein
MVGGRAHIGDGKSILHNDVNQQVAAIRSRRYLIHKDIAADACHFRIRKREVQCSLYLPAELLGFPLRLATAGPVIVFLSIENLSEVHIQMRIWELRTSSSTILSFQNKALLLRAGARTMQAHECTCGFN